MLFKCVGIVRKANVQVRFKVAREEKGSRKVYLSTPVAERKLMRM